MSPLRFAWSLTALLALVLTLLAPVNAGVAAGSASASSLSVSPSSNFVAGQQLTLRGKLGSSGGRPVVIEFNMGRPGDIWRLVPGSRGRTRAGGRFALRTPAPSMRGISYRVRSGKMKTPSRMLSALTQDVWLEVESGSGGLSDDQAVAGQSFSVRATTTPVLAGRTVTIQQRVGNQAWVTFGSTTTDQTGSARFIVSAQPAGQLVYRVRAENWLLNGDRVGWTPSFPHYVNVTSDPSPRGRAVASYRRSSDARAVARPQSTAHSTYRWGPHLFDFDWEYGESLTSPPLQGTRRRGGWLDVSDGTGRVAIFNGAMQMESGQGVSHGSLWSVLQRNAQARGRWETRVMPLRGNSPVMIELVQPGASTESCVAPSITIARLSPAQGVVDIGATGYDGSSWNRTLTLPTSGQFHAFAVEVRGRAIHWLIDGKVVGRLNGASTVIGKKLTVRITLGGSADQTSDISQTLVDWVRGVPLGHGRTVRGGAKLSRGTAAGC